MLEPLLEELKLVIEQKIEFENLELLFDTTFWNFRQITNRKQREKLHARESVPGSWQMFSQLKQRNRASKFQLNPRFYGFDKSLSFAEFSKVIDFNKNLRTKPLTDSKV